MRSALYDARGVDPPPTRLTWAHRPPTSLSDANTDMLPARAKTSIATAAKSLVALAALTLTGCPNGDVGAPCNHGTVNPPSSFLVTFPALSCNDLLCIYGEDKEVPTEITGCTNDSDCNVSNPGQTIFSCTDDGTCELSIDYVLERSMCSKKCASDEDCNNQSAFDKPAVDDDETACDSEFKCVVLQELGEFCCESVCVCNDDLPGVQMLQERCRVEGKEAVCNTGTTP